MAINLDIEGVPELKRSLDKLGGREANNRLRRSLRAGVKVIREEMRRQASARSDLPRTFRKTRTRAHRNPIGVSVAPQSLLSNIFEVGAASHGIGDSGQLLSNPKTDFTARGPVSHPGMKARPFIAPVFAAAEDKAVKAFADEMTKDL